MNAPTQDARHVPMTRAQKLAADAADAAQVRAFAEHPDVIALQVERVRKQIDVLMWTGILLGLAFTMVNVQSFAAEDARVWSLAWIAAWLLDPMVSLVLIAVLRAEQVTARWQVDTGRWIRRTKWFAFAATYLMNTWQSYAALHLAGIVLHSVPPLLVYLASESAPVLRDRLTESVRRAAQHRPPAAAPPAHAEVPAEDPAHPDERAAAPVASAQTDTTPSAHRARTTAPRKRSRARAPKGRERARTLFDQHAHDGTLDALTGAQIGQAGGVSPATGRRWIAQWREEHRPQLAVVGEQHHATGGTR